MGNTSDAVRHAARDQARAARIRDLLQERIGESRYAVWFGPTATVVVEAPDGGTGGGGGRGRRRTPPSAGSERVIVRAGTGVTHEWLKRTFRSDVERAVREVCGSQAEVVWQASDPEDPSPAAVVRCGPAETAGAVEPAMSERSPRPSARRRPRTASAEPPPRSQGGVCEPRGARSLDDFIVGPSNRLACSAVELAATRPGEVSPLVIHGPSGVGKTHLLDGVCARARELHPGAVVISLSAEQFTNGFLQSLHGSGLPGFRRTCRSADLLVIDDIQFLVGKRATLLEFQLTVDALHRLGRQMVFTCDRELDALAGLGPELLTRLRGGMQARIVAPDYDVRRGIVVAVCARRSLAVPDEVVHYVATHMTRHARELLGAVNRLEATSLMLGLPVSVDMAEEALADLVRSSARSVRLADVERAVCTAFGIEPGSLQSSRRARTVSQPRMLAMFLARKHTHAALADIGRYFGRRSHSTVIAAQKAVGEWVSRRSPVVLAEAEWDIEEAIRRVEDLLRAG